jgi:hypothetical protein
MSGTQSYYLNSYNTDSGMIISWLIYSPQYFLSRAPAGQPRPDLPEIQRWSDVAWIEWWNQCGGDVSKARNINYFLIHEANNRYWRQLAASEYLNSADGAWEFPLWNSPGNNISSMQSDLGKQFLASPLGRGVAWFLISHKDVLGKKEVTGIRVFRPEGVAASADTASMLLYVNDVVPGKSQKPRYKSGATCCVVL